MFAPLTKLHLQARISLLVTLGLLLIFTAMAWQGMQALQTATELVLNERLALARLVALHVDEDLERTLERLTQVVARPTIDLEDGNMEPEKAELRALRRSQLFSYVFLLDRGGLVLWTEPYLSDVVGQQYLECPSVQQALRTGNPAIACVKHALTPQSPVVAPVMPIRNRDGTVVGLLGVAIDPSSPEFTDILKGIAPGQTGYVQLVDENGIVMVHTEGRALFQRSEHADLFLSLLQAGQTGMATYAVTEEGKGTFREVIAFAPLTVAPWGVAVEQAEAELLGSALALRDRMFLFATVALAGALLLAWITTRSVVTPVRKLVAASQRIAGGDLATPVPPLGQDEIGELGQAFDDMRQRLARWSEELEAKVAERTRELSALYGIDRAIARSLELEEVLNSTVEAILNTLDIEAGGIYLLEPDGETMTLRVQRGLSDQFVDAVQRIRLGEGIAGLAAARGEPVVLDAADYPTERLTALISQEGFKTLASAPLVSGGKVVGALNLGTRRDGAFPPDQLELLAAVGQQLGQAVQNARLYQETQQRLSREERMNELARALGGALELPTLFPHFLPPVVELSGADAGTVAILDPFRQVITYPYHYNLPDTLAGVEVPAGTGLAGLAMERGQPILLDDYGAHPAALTPWVEAGVRSVLAVPLQVGDRVVGAMGLFSLDEVRPFDEDTVAIAQAAGHLAAVAIQRARLFESERKRAAQLALVADIAQRVAPILEPDRLLQEAAEAIQQALGYYDVILFLVDQAAGELILKARAGSFERPFPHAGPARKKIGEIGIIDWVARQGDTLLANDVSQEPRYLPFLPATRSELCVPIKEGERVVAGINVECERRYAFDEADVTALELLAAELSVALTNARLYEAERRRARHTQALNAIISAAAGQPDLASLLEVALDHTLRALGLEMGAIWLRATPTAPPRGVVRGLPAEIEQVSRQIAARADLNLTQPHITTDWLENPDPPQEMALRFGIRASVVVPLVATGQRVGGLSVAAPEPRAWAADEIALVEAIGQQLGSAVERVRLFEELHDRVQELTTVYDVSKTIAASLRIQEVLDFIVSAATRATQAEGCYLFLWDEQQRRLVLRAVEGFYQGHVGRMKYRLGEGLAGWVFLERQPANVPDVGADPRWKRDPQHEATLPAGRANNALVVPLVVGGKARGVLGVVNRIGAPAFTESDQSLLTTLAGQVAIAIENARLYEDVRGLSVATIRSLATAIDARDPYTRGHSEETARLTVQIARELGWGGTDLEMLEFAALLHDVGKIGIPDAILRKVEPLTPDEKNTIQLHPYHSAQIIKPVQALKRIVPWVYHHHEWWNGEGYPDGLKGEDIPLASRIIAVADAYDAVTTDRPYRRGRTHEEAIEELGECAGTQFDPQVVEAFLRVIEPTNVPLSR